MSSSQKGMSEARERLIKLMMAAKDGNSKLLRKTVRSLCSKSNRSTSSEALVLGSYVDGAGRTAMHFAANFGQVDALKYIVNTAPDSTKWTDNDGATGLLLAALGGHLRAVKFLAEAGSLLEAAKNNGDRAMHLAARHNHHALLRYLVEAGAELEVVGSGGTPLWVAAGEGSTESVNALIDAGANVDAYNSDNITPLTIAAAMGHFDAAAALIKAGADASLAGREGLTAMHMAAEQGRLELVRLLLDASTDLALVKNSAGLKPVELAAGCSHREVVEALLPVSALDASVTADSLIAHLTAERKREEAEHKAKALAALPPAAKSTEDAAAALELKKQGNRAFLKGQYAEAIETYSAALKLDGRNAATVKPEWAKAYYREGKALAAFGRYWEAAKRDTSVKEFRSCFQDALQRAKDAHNAKAAGDDTADAAGAATDVADDSSAGAGAGAGAGSAAAAAPATTDAAATETSPPGGSDAPASAVSAPAPSAES